MSQRRFKLSHPIEASAAATYGAQRLTATRNASASQPKESTPFPTHRSQSIPPSRQENRAESLSETLAALAPLAAGDLALEAVIVDDNSRDATRAVVEARTARAVRGALRLLRRSGASATRSASARRSRSSATRWRPAAACSTGRAPSSITAFRRSA
jgi:hypothetical protein